MSRNNQGNNDLNDEGHNDNGSLNKSDLKNNKNNHRKDNKSGRNRNQKYYNSNNRFPQNKHHSYNQHNSQQYNNQYYGNNTYQNSNSQSNIPNNTQNLQHNLQPNLQSNLQPNLQSNLQPNLQPNLQQTVTTDPYVMGMYYDTIYMNSVLMTKLNQLELVVTEQITKIQTCQNEMVKMKREHRMEINSLKRKSYIGKHDYHNNSSNKRYHRDIENRDSTVSNYIDNKCLPKGGKVCSFTIDMNNLNKYNEKTKSIIKNDDKFLEKDNISIDDLEFEEINVDIKTLQDLIDLAEKYENIKVEYEKNHPKDIQIESNTNINTNNDKIEEDKNIGSIGAKSLKSFKSDICDSMCGGFNNPCSGSAMSGQDFVSLIFGGIKKMKSNGINNIKNYEVKTMFPFAGKKYSVDLNKVINLKKPLTTLNSMIGLDNIKKNIVRMIIYYLQYSESENNSLLHTVIQGPPGVGKTELGKLLAEIYASMGIINSSKFKLVKRTDLVGEYLGHTAKKTQDAIDEAEGGVLFIDEAYSLGNDEKKDSYSKECIDTLNQNLTENKNFICIIAGYEKDLEKCFFQYNEGLRSRFPFTFEIEGYTHQELSQIFMKKIGDIKFKLDGAELDIKEIDVFFKDHINNFKYYGRDVTNLIDNCKMMSALRTFGKDPKNKNSLIKDDLIKGFQIYTVLNKHKNDNTTKLIEHIYM